MQHRHACAGTMIVLGASISLICPLFAQDGGPSEEKAKIAAGETVYNTYCQVCHGDALVSTGQVFDLRRLTANDRGRFENSVRNGKNQMPPWKGALSDEQIDQVWHYIRANAYQK